MKTFIDYTTGFLADSPALKKLTMLKAEYNRLESGDVEISAVSANNLNKINKIQAVTVSAEDFTNRDSDPYNSVVEAEWALNKLGVSIAR